MRYTGNICDGCNEPLLDSEDIVVCPECGTPQHRHCYDKNNQCVNANFHGSEFAWQGVVSEKTSAESSTLVNENKQGDDIICPNCKQSNPAGTEICRHCGMKFTMFGINVVETLNEQQKNEDIYVKPSDIPEYEAPFTVGEGEGFDNIPTEEDYEPRPVVSPEDPEYFDDESNIFKGPYSHDDVTATVRTNTLGAFIRNNAQTYISKFKANDITGKSSFNWAAFFFAPYWFFYRKLYKPGIIMMTLQLCASIVAMPSMEKFFQVYENLATVDFATMTEEAFALLSAEIETAMIPVSIFLFFTFILHLISGFIANGLYKNHIIKNINFAMTLPTVREKISHFAKHGGASLIAVLAAYFAQTALSYLAAYLMY